MIIPDHENHWSGSDIVIDNVIFAKDRKSQKTDPLILSLVRKDDTRGMKFSTKIMIFCKNADPSKQEARINQQYH